MAKRTETKAVAVFVRLTEEQAARLDAVQHMPPALRSRPDAVRRLLDLLTLDDVSMGDAAEGKEPMLSAADAAGVVDSIKERTRAYNDLARQLSAIGSNVNQIARAENTLARLGRDGHVKPEILASIQEGIEAVRDRLSVLAHQDSYLDDWLR